MRKIIFAQVLAENGTSNFIGLYDRNCEPVRVEIEKDDSGVVLTILRESDEDDEEDEWLCPKNRPPPCQKGRNFSVLVDIENKL